MKSNTVIILNIFLILGLFTIFAWILFMIFLLSLPGGQTSWFTFLKCYPLFLIAGVFIGFFKFNTRNRIKFKILGLIIIYVPLITIIVSFLMPN